MSDSTVTPAYAAGRTEPWTYESLAAQDRRTLEQVMLTGTMPDWSQAEGHTYRGFNHEWIAELSGRKFKKGFREKDGRPFGYNLRVVQDRKGPGGEWRLKTGRDGKLGFHGYYRVVELPAAAPHKPFDRYRSAWLLDYGVSENVWLDFPLRVIRDVVVLPNPGDHELMLGKAYLRLGFKRLNLFYSYFLLTGREPIDSEPPWVRGG